MKFKRLHKIMLDVWKAITARKFQAISRKKTVESKKDGDNND